MKATFIRVLSGFQGIAKLYACEPGGDLPEHVIVSAADVPFSGPETYIFPSDADGNVTDWGELPGSTKGRVSHEACLRGAGYDVE